jgi:Kdo2-lipid IVA lauroyltransferase/acyltransferase
MSSYMIESLEYGVFKAFALAFACLPRPFCLTIGEGLGRMAYRLDKKHRAITLDNLAVAFGRELPAPEREALARRAFEYIGRTIADILKLSCCSREKILGFFRTEGRENLKKALAKGRGVLLFTAHFGNWEIATAAVAEIHPVRVIARPLDNRFLERELTKLRTKFGASIISKFKAGRPIFQALKNNEIVGILIDQNVLRSQAVFVDFFGKQAATTPALAAFHVRTGAPIVPIFCYPTETDRYRIKIFEPIEPPLAGPQEQDVLKITQICTKIIEREIRQNPGTWLWVHKRWNTRPIEEERKP